MIVQHMKRRQDAPILGNLAHGAHVCLIAQVLGHEQWPARPASRPRRGAVRGGGAPTPVGRLGCLCRASAAINRALVLAHPVLEVSGAAITGSKDALDERILPPVPIFAGQDWRPFHFSTDPIIKNPCFGL